MLATLYIKHFRSLSGKFILPLKGALYEIENGYTENGADLMLLWKGNPN